MIKETKVDEIMNERKIDFDNKYKINQLIHKLDIIVLFVSDKITTAEINVIRSNTKKFVESILKKMKNDCIITDTQYNYTRNDTQKLGDTPPDTPPHISFVKKLYKSDINIIKNMFLNLKNEQTKQIDAIRIKFLELFCEGFPYY